MYIGILLFPGRNTITYVHLCICLFNYISIDVDNYMIMYYVRIARSPYGNYVFKQLFKCGI